MLDNILYTSEETDFSLHTEEEKFTRWINKIITDSDKIPGEISYIFCSDEYLLDINKKYLNHDYYTDIVTFDYTENGIVSGDLFISIERVKNNAMELNVSFENELQRVMAHGILHLLGYKDKTPSEIQLMRSKEEESISLF